MQYKFSEKHDIEDQSEDKTISDLTRSNMFQGPISPTTEMVLHMKGPIYSVAERKINTASSMSHFKNRAYMTNASPNEFFRQPKQEFVSEVNISKTNRRNLRAQIESNAKLNTGKNIKC